VRPAWAFFLNSLEVSESMEQRMLVRETEQGAYLGPGPELEAAALPVAATRISTSLIGAAAPDPGKMLPLAG
jgi:hypothetical protein